MSSDCGFGRQGCNREIAFYKASAIAQGCNIVRQELGLGASYIPAADPALQMDIVPKTAQHGLERLRVASVHSHASRRNRTKLPCAMFATS